MIREIVTIDEALCDGCGVCIPACHEGALRIVDGKARLVADKLCDGLGACLGHCPRGAIKIAHREADAFDDVPPQPAPPPAPSAPVSSGCPGSRFTQFAPAAATRATRVGENTTPGQSSELTHWPVQLRLLPPQAAVLRGASLLVAADCVPVAYADFHARLLRGRAVVIGCPKFDDLPGYVDKLTEMIRASGLREIVVARMEVPCCAGIVAAVVEARRRAGTNTPITEIVVSTRGEVLAERNLPAQLAG
jgi:Fe-S-cluster-containing hydrogenase component 2